MFRMKPIVLLAGLAFYLTGCTTTPPVKYSDVTEGQWEAKVLIKDHENAKSHIVNVDAYAVRGQNLRIDVTAALGTHVASLVLNGDEVRYILPRKKSYFEGKSSEKVLRPILSVPVDPRLFYSMLFDVAPEEEDWSCETSDKGFLSGCENRVQGLSVEWKDRNGRKKSVLVEHEKASLQMNVTWFKPSLDPEKNIFSLRAPKKFKRYRIK
jgi:hypothetical protein